MTYTYLFILGRNPILSKKEIEAFFIYHNFKASFFSLPRDILGVNTDIDFEKNNIIKLLGGTIKIARVFSEDINFSNQIVIDFIEEQKLNISKFGLSFYNFYISKFQILRNCKIIKKYFKDKNISTNFVVSKDESYLTSVQYIKKIFNHGNEFIILKNDNKFIYSYVVSCQNISLWQTLDYGISDIDPESGMLPPKLAQIMINLALPDKEKKDLTIYDPFCGTGRVILQTLFSGFNAFGSDNDKEKVTKTRNNVSWLMNNIKIKDNNFLLDRNLFSHDMRHSIPKINNIDAIVTEPYLGPSYKEMPQKDEIIESFAKLSGLYLDSFMNFRSILNKNSKVVFVFPQIKSIDLLNQIIDKIIALGYHKIDNFVYQRKYQIVKRNIGVFKLE